MEDNQVINVRYTITFAEEDYQALTEHLFVDRTVERGAYALCRISVSGTETRLLVRTIIPVAAEDIEEATETGMRIHNRSFLRVMKKAAQTNQVFMFIHSHPERYKNHSRQDDEQEADLFKTAYNRIRIAGVHASLVLSSPDKPVARVWLEDGTTCPVDLIRVLGNRFRFYGNLLSDKAADPLPMFFDRQMRAFGEDIQRLLRSLHIGVVGVGGTGSAVSEQLTRLGVGSVTVFDGETFEKTNVNRVYGSSSKSDGKEKVKIVKEHVDFIDVGTNIQAVNKPITFLSTVDPLKSCDIVFGCSDDNWGRSILTQLAIYYHIPVFDMGVKIDSDEGTIKGIQGRVTTVMPGTACLWCRERISAKQVESESLAILDPEKLKALQKEGYADELETNAPAVIPFTTTVAAAAVSEMLHRLTGFMGEERESTEVIILFDQSRIRTNNRATRIGCMCSDAYSIRRGDCNPFLDLTWRNEA